MLCTGTKSEMAHMWAQWLPNPCRLWGLQCSARGQIRYWPTCYSGHLTLAVSGVSNALHVDKFGNGPHVVGMQIRSEFNLNSPNSLRIRSQREFAANSA